VGCVGRGEFVGHVGVVSTSFGVGCICGLKLGGIRFCVYLGFSCLGLDLYLELSHAEWHLRKHITRLVR
jgi:hypothetical protein